VGCVQMTIKAAQVTLGLLRAVKDQCLASSKTMRSAANIWSCLRQFGFESDKTDPVLVRS